MRLDFFIVGAQKAGTTALDAMLRRHTGVQMRGLQNTALKEAHFFDPDVGAAWAPDCDDLHRHFDWNSPACRGEATPIYLYWPEALDRLKAYNPAAKIIVSLRHPSLRAYSHWKMESGRGLETLSFARAIRDGRQRVSGAPGGVHRIFSYVERGLYDDQIARLLTLFPREQILFCRSDEFYRQPGWVLTKIEAFLGLAPMLGGARTELIRPTAARTFAPMSSNDRVLLDTEFAPRYARTEALTGLNLADWRDPAYAETW